MWYQWEWLVGAALLAAFLAALLLGGAKVTPRSASSAIEGPDQEISTQGPAPTDTVDISPAGLLRLGPGRSLAFRTPTGVYVVENADSLVRIWHGALMWRIEKTMSEAEARRTTPSSPALWAAGPLQVIFVTRSVRGAIIGLVYRPGDSRVKSLGNG